MRTKYKFLFLVFAACISSIIIYYFCEKSQPVKYVQNIVDYQNKLDETNFKVHNYTVENPNIIVNPYEISPLTALIIFETKDLTTPSITVVGKNKDTTFKNTFKPAKVHYLPVYGLYPNTDNKVIVTINSKEYEYTIKTEALPENFVKSSNVTGSSNELFFVTPSIEGYTAGYDSLGDVRWYLNDYFIWEIKRLNNGNLMLGTNRLVNPPYYNTGLVEMDLLGKVYYEYSIPGGYHHDYFELDNGNLIVASNKFENETVEDYIVEIDRQNGKIVKEIDLRKIIEPGEGWNKNYTTDFDWFHNNSVWYDFKTNSLTLSGRHTDAIININYDTLDLNYIIGDHSNWSKKYEKYLLDPINDLEWNYAQHAAKVLPNGNIIVFDNGNNKSKENELVKAKDNYSRAVIYEVNTSKMEIKQVWQYGRELESAFYSPYISDVDYLGEDHYLVHSGGISYNDGKINNIPAGLEDYDKLVSYTKEIKNNKVVRSLEIASNYYRAEKMPLYNNNNYSLKEGISLGDLGETKTARNSSILMFNKNADKIIKEKNIEITKESDRLVVKGKFKKTDSVEIILDNVFDKKTYDIVVAKRPYTAMCVDVFTEDEETNGLNITKYINDLGLKGKYYIYMKINGKYYDFDKSVTFK